MKSQAGHSFTDGTNFCCGQTFADKKELKMQLDAAAVSQSFNYYMEKRWKKLMKAQCLSHGCGWLLRAKKYDTSNRFFIYKYVWMHMCGVENTTRRHKKVSSKLIASVSVNHFWDGKGPSIREIQRIIFKELRCNASYWMCWKKSVITKNIIRGTPEHGYACLSAFSHMVELLNLGSSYSIMVNLMDGSFVYYFLAFGACIRGYVYMRKVIFVDGTHLYGKYEGVLLSAVAQDTENHIFSIAFCVVDKENDAFWTFFFQKLKSIIEDEPDLCVISDRHISIANAFSHVYSRAHHGLFIRHLAENLRVNQHCEEHLYLFYSTEAYSFDDFSDNFVELKSKCPEAAHVLENVLGFEKWSRAHFSDNRYVMMTTNIAESLNSILMDEREYPVSYIFNSIAKKFGKKFRERHAFVGGKDNIFVPSAERILRDNKSANDSLYVGNPNGVLDEYTVFGSGVTVKVNLLE
ncbi:hypothetical protein P3L10_000506 [Capsicum annuum]